MALLSIMFHTNDADLVSETMPRLHVKPLSGLMLQNYTCMTDRPAIVTKRRRVCVRARAWVANKHCPLLANGEKCNVPGSYC